ncbi:MAG: helix-turn-helix domain-containing protein [Blastochloris sp.]|nr:helix-turn-helix domain-containing protein [Blastochloris sp.]
MDKISFGSKLRQLREEKNISLRELAKRIGVSGAFLSDIELGRRFPSADKLEFLAKEIGVPAEELKQYDFRDEAEAIRNMMFADPKAGLAFRSILQSELSLEEIQKIVSKQKGK